MDRALGVLIMKEGGEVGNGKTQQKERTEERTKDRVPRRPQSVQDGTGIRKKKAYAKPCSIAKAEAHR